MRRYSTARSPIQLALVTIVVIATWTAIAAGRKVIVLPLDGSVDAAERTRLTAEVVKVARANGGDVTTGNTTFAETAAAVGCDPQTPACGDTVLVTLGVDEVIFGSATKGTPTTLVLSRVAKGEPRHDQTIVVAPTDPPGKLDTDLDGLWHTPASTTALGSGSNAPEGAGSDVTRDRSSFFDTRDRKLGFGFVAGGAVTVVIGVALWLNERSLQHEIDMLPTATPQNIIDLRAREDRASAYAWTGNAFVLVGLAAAGVGAYYLWTDREARASATVVPTDRGVTAVIRGSW